MSEIKLNLIDAQTILVGTVHGSVGDQCVAALSAEPETIGELEAALKRFDNSPVKFHIPYVFTDRCDIDEEPYDAGILIIDMVGRIVACDSTYSQPGPEGVIEYHDGNHCTGIPIGYCLPDDWLFLSSVADYKGARCDRREKRMSNPPLDARTILYGTPLLEFLATNIRIASALQFVDDEDTGEELGLNTIGQIHAQWLLTPRLDLQGQSPREVMLAKQNFIDTDLDSRALQWSLLLEGPPCIAKESYAYRYAGFGTHEWVMYYDLIRHLLTGAITIPNIDALDFHELVQQLNALKNDWLNEPNPALEGRVPAIIIDNERRRLPEALGGRSMVIDEDCPLCKMMGDECEAGREVCFWHLDCSAMDNHFAFSTFLTEKEYLEDQLEMEVRHREFDRRWKEREELIARGELPPDRSFVDVEEYVPSGLLEPDLPEA